LEHESMFLSPHAKKTLNAETRKWFVTVASKAAVSLSSDSGY
jgi:hypothetical protein